MKKKMFGIVAGVSALFIASGLVAGEKTLMKLDTDAKVLQKEWTGNVKYEDLDGKLCGVVDNNKNIVFRKFIPVEADKKYTLIGTFKSLGEEKSKVYYGFICYDKNKKRITALHANVLLGTATTLAQECKKGDKTLVIKANKKWKKGNYAIAFNAKDDLSDIPNREVVYKITKVVPEGDNMELQLPAPLKKAYPAGTKVRLHTSKYGSYLYTTIVGAKMPNIWKTYSGTVAIGKPGEMGWKYFRPGTAFVRVIILPNYSKKEDEKIAFKDLSLKVSE